MQTKAVWQMSAMAPAASIQPVDGLVGGGSELTITVAAKGEFRGDGLFDSGHDSMRHDSMLNYTTGPYFVLLGDVKGEVIGHTIDGVGPRLRVTVKFKTPKATTAGQVWCSLSIGFVGKSSISKQFRIENFPPALSPADFAVTFGNIHCDGMLCGITSIEVSKFFSIITVTVPLLPVGKTAVNVAYVGAPLPPLGNDGSAFVRTLRSAELAGFQVLSATPAFLGIRFCQVCGTQSCLSASGLCGDNTQPLSSRIPKGVAGFLVLEINRADVFKNNLQVATFEAVSATAFFSGNSQAFLTFKQVVVIDRTRGGQIALEFVVPKMNTIGKSAGTLTISSPARLLPVALMFQVHFFDNSFSLEGAGILGCQ